MPRHYSFVTVWDLGADTARVWDAILDVERWPEWWPSVRAVTRLEAGSADGVGAAHRFTWRGRLPYTLTFDMRVTELANHRRLVGVATGELEGSGAWTLEPHGSGTRARYDWNVATLKPWMNAVAPVLTPVFRWNHDAVMKAGGEGLARRLGCRLEASEA